MSDQNELLDSASEETEIQKVQNDTVTDDLFVPDSVLMPIIESIIFASESPVTAQQLKAILDEGKQEFNSEIPVGRILEVIERIKIRYESSDEFSFTIHNIADGYFFMTKATLSPWIARLYSNRHVKKLSQAALETLAIISYKQPLSKPEVEQIRGVNADYAVKTLLEKNLITVVGRSESVGKPLLYGTTKEFLMHFGLKSISELPKPREISELIKDEDFEFEQQMKIRVEEGQSEETEKEELTDSQNTPNADDSAVEKAENGNDEE